MSLCLADTKSDRTRKFQNCEMMGSPSAVYFDKIPAILFDDPSNTA